MQVDTLIESTAHSSDETDLIQGATGLNVLLENHHVNHSGSVLVFRVDHLVRTTFIDRDRTTQTPYLAVAENPVILIEQDSDGDWGFRDFDGEYIYGSDLQQLVAAAKLLVA